MKRSALPMALLSLLACVSGGDATPPRLSLKDPLGLMDVVGDLRLLIFPADERSCTADGTVEPTLSDEPGATFEDAIVDLSFGVDEPVTVTLNVGTYVVLVRGRGTDPVSMRTGVIVATGCAADVTIGDGETSEITVELQDVVGTGVCDDGVLSPDEQCEAATGPTPCDACRTQPFVAHTTTDGAQANPGLGWASGARYVLSFDEVNREGPIRLMVRDERGQIVTSPRALEVDQAVDFDVPLPGAQTTSAAASSPARLGVAFGDFSTALTEGGDILVRFFNTDRVPAAPATLAGPRAMAQTQPTMAMTPDGTALVAFLDAAAPTGASFVHFVATATDPSSSPTPVGTTTVRSIDVAASAEGFVVATGGTGVSAHRVAADGSLVDASPIEVSTDDAVAVAVAALDDGRFFVAWEAGGEIRGRAFAADGTPRAAPQAIGRGAAPAAGAGGGRYLVAWERGGEIRARLYNGDGAAARNRERPPTPEEFLVGSGSQPRVAVGGPTAQALAAVTWVSDGDVQSRLYPLP